MRTRQERCPQAVTDHTALRSCQFATLGSQQGLLAPTTRGPVEDRRGVASGCGLAQMAIRVAGVYRCRRVLGRESHPLGRLELREGRRRRCHRVRGVRRRDHTIRRVVGAARPSTTATLTRLPKKVLGLHKESASMATSSAKLQHQTLQNCDPLASGESGNRNLLSTAPIDLTAGVTTGWSRQGGSPRQRT